MNDAELKELAEFGAKFLGFNRITVKGIRKYNSFEMWEHPDWEDDANYLSDSELPDEFFGDHETASYLSHLAKRKMEKLGFDHQSERLAGTTYYGFFGQLKDAQAICAIDKNEYIALWMAIRRQLNERR